jgi:hypothetical protein
MITAPRAYAAGAGGSAIMPATRQAARSIRHTRSTRSRITAQSRTAAGSGEVRFRKNGPVHPQLQPAVSRSGVTSDSSLQLLRRVRIPLVQVSLLTLCNLLLKRVQRLISGAASGAQHFSSTALRHRPAEPAFGTPCVLLDPHVGSVSAVELGTATRSSCAGTVNLIDCGRADTRRSDTWIAMPERQPR